MAQDLSTTVLYDKTLASLLGALIGDAIGTPTEGLDYREIEARFGWVDDFDCDGTDDTVMKVLLAEALIATEGYASIDDWARQWLDDWDAIFGDKRGKFFISVLHTAQKLRRHAIPRRAALGNMPSSSSAMCISPVGIVNACHPRQAALQAYNLAALIHEYDVGFCQDGAAAMAAAVAEAFKPDAGVESVLQAAQDAILPQSGAEMLARIDHALKLARELGDYRVFCQAVYADPDRFFCRITCDSRETIPLTLALLYLGNGDVESCVTYAANLGRDADTIATMVGAIAGALNGVKGIREDWVSKAHNVSSWDQRILALRLCQAALSKHEQETQARSRFEELLPGD
jgi:ADP-ribosylglycohydrolase